MAIAFATSTNAFFQTLDEGKSIRVLANVVVSGSYATGGEDLTTLLADERIKVGAAASQRGTPISAYAQSQNGVNYSITNVPGQSPLKMKVFTAANTELGAGAYSATYTNDIIRLDISFQKYGSMARVAGNL